MFKVNNKDTDVFLVSLLGLNIFRNLFQCFYCRFCWLCYVKSNLSLVFLIKVLLDKKKYAMLFCSRNNVLPCVYFCVCPVFNWGDTVKKNRLYESIGWNKMFFASLYPYSAFTCSKLIIETLKQGMKYVQSQQ